MLNIGLVGEAKRCLKKKGYVLFLDLAASCTKACQVMSIKSMRWDIGIGSNSYSLYIIPNYEWISDVLPVKIWITVKLKRSTNPYFI